METLPLGLNAPRVAHPSSSPVRIFPINRLALADSAAHLPGIKVQHDARLSIKPMIPEVLRPPHGDAPDIIHNLYSVHEVTAPDDDFSDTADGKKRNPWREDHGGATRNGGWAPVKQSTKSRTLHVQTTSIRVREVGTQLLSRIGAVCARRVCSRDYPLWFHPNERHGGHQTSCRGKHPLFPRYGQHTRVVCGGPSDGVSIIRGRSRRQPNYTL